MVVPSLEAVKKALATPLEPVTMTYTERDVSLYALGIGAGADPLDATELRYIHEGAPDFRALPGFALTFTRELTRQLLRGEFAGLRYDPAFAVHGEQLLELRAPLPKRAIVRSSLRIRDIQDKGSGMLLIIESESETDAGAPLAYSRSSVFIRGFGGYGGHRGESAKIAMPEGPPDIVCDMQTRRDQALLYRLSGDLNPLHIDPGVAAWAGYAKPILHGLCSFGFASRALIQVCCAGDAGRLIAIGARFSQPVYPGETLSTEIWRLMDGEVRFRTRVKERGVVALSQGHARIAG